MAIQTHTNIYQENLGLPISFQNNFFMENNNNNNNFLFNYNNLHQQQSEYMKRINLYGNDDSCMFLQRSKKQKLAMNFEQSLCVQLEKQRNEIDKFVDLQNEWLKLALHEQRKQQLGAIIKKLEAKAVQLLQQKDDQISEGTKKSIELQEIITKLEVDNQTWQRIASENESIAFSLNNTLQQLIKQQQEVCSSSSSTNSVDKVTSDDTPNYMGFNSRQHQSRPCYSLNKNHSEEKRVICKVCRSRNACVLMLPCKHMCCCNVCDVISHACPVCKLAKMASVDVLFS